VLANGLRIVDPFAIRADSRLPDMRGALDPTVAERHVGALLHSEAPVLESIRVVRHKPGRRCMIEYIFRDSDQPVAVLGKVRARGLDRRSFDTQLDCWRAGVAVPEPLGIVPDFEMWVQRKVPGVELTSQIISHRAGSELMRQVADQVFQLHESGVPTRKSHDINDEMEILIKRLGMLTVQRPDLASRIAWVLLGAERLGTSLRPGMTCGIHRDFYPDQVIIDEKRSWLVDLDLYCRGDAGLDIGNFSGHLIELGLRLGSDPDMFLDERLTFEQRYIELAGPQMRESIEVYTTLTLARHVQLSTQLPGREHTTELLLGLCEERLRHVV
jgi:hypothetical protein